MAEAGDGTANTGVMSEPSPHEPKQTQGHPGVHNEAFLGWLFLFDDQVFRTEAWVSSDGEIVLHTLELDLVAKAPTEEEAADKLGGLILDLFESLIEETERTEAEDETLRLIVERVGPPIVKYHARREQGIFGALRRQLTKRIEWAQQTQSAQEKSELASHV